MKIFQIVDIEWSDYGDKITVLETFMAYDEEKARKIAGQAGFVGDKCSSCQLKEVKPDEIELPEGYEWLDERHVGIKCLKCGCTYTLKYWSDYNRESKGRWFGGFPTGKCEVCRRQAREKKRETMPMDLALVEGVRKYAMENYEKGGWDYVIECYNNEEIWEVIAGARTLAGAIKKMSKVAELLAERRSEIESTRW